MPICIECRYPVPQLYHVLHSTKQHKSVPTHSSSPLSSDPTAHAGATSLPSHPTPPFPPAAAAAAAVTSPSSSSTLAAQGGGGGGKEAKIPAKAQTPQGGAGGDVRLTQCPRCKRFADKYVEHDFVVLFIDLVLVKPQVYRHLLFNRLGRDDDELDPSITRLGILLLLFDVYLTWSHIESLPPHLTAGSPIPALPIPLQYVFYLLLSLLSVLAQHATIRFLVRKTISSHSSSTSSSTSPSSPSSSSSSSSTTTATAAAAPSLPTPKNNPAHPTPSAISTALFVSSGMKLFPLLMVVWGYEDHPRSHSAHNRSSSSSSNPGNAAGSGGSGGEGNGASRTSEWGSVGTGVEWAVAVQNLEALRILLGCGYWAAGALVAAGWIAGQGVRALMLGLLGLGEAGRV